jgi:hypothetical protein
LSVPIATDLTKLAPTYDTGSPHVTGQPASGAVTDSTKPQSYIITAANGRTCRYLVTVNPSAGAVALANPGFEARKRTGDRDEDIETEPSGVAWTFITEPLNSHEYFKTVHQNKELFPSFDQLTVWEYTHILSSGATDADLTWAREMVNTFRPDLRQDEMVVNSTSFVWRRSAPPQFYPNGGYQDFKNVLAGGGKCGPRSSWSQMVCHAFGIPAIGVGQPGHA